ncbi:MAG: ATPase, T2SS/T4P/T4SS family [Candidatus Aenigmatarchaeota archaeon]
MRILDSYKLFAEGVPAEINIVKIEGEFVPIYEVSLPKFEEATLAVLSAIRERLITEVGVKVQEILDPRVMEDLKQRFFAKSLELIQRQLPRVSEEEKKILAGTLVHEMLGLGKVEVLLKDENLEEIVINNSQEPLWVYHKKYGWLKTNIVIKSDLEIYNYASMIGRKVGRQITSLNPLMDAHLTTGDRVNATLFPISTKGNTITIRKFARKPWTITDLIKNNTINKEVASLLWLAIHYEMNIIVSGGTATGKTSILNVLTTFIPPNHRIVSIEDSVTGDCEILFERKGEIFRKAIGELIDSLLPDGEEKVENKDNIKIFSMDKDGKIKLALPSHFIRHKVKKKVLDIILASGRKISVTEDHSLFGLNENGEIVPIPGKEIKVGSFIAVPRILPYEGKKKVFDLSLELEKFKGCFVEVDKEFIRKNFKKLVESKLLSKQQAYYYLKKGVLKAEVLQKLNVKPRKGKIKSRSGSFLPLKVSVNKDLALVAGLWLADGCYDRNSVIFSVTDEESKKIIRKIAKRFRMGCKLHSDKISLMLNSKLFKTFFKEVLGLEGNAYTKRVPSWVFGLEKEELAAFLKGYFSGDGWVRSKDVAVSSVSFNLLKDIQTLLLRFGIPLRIGKKFKDNTYQATISGSKFLKTFFYEVGFLQEKNNEKLFSLLHKKVHDVSDVVPLPKHFYLRLKKLLKEEVGVKRSYKGWKSWHRNYMKSNIGRELLKEIVSKIANDGGNETLIKLANNDIFWDRVKEIKEREFEGYVYDISVPGNESFVCNNIIAHNTREIQLPDFLHWVPLTTREPNPEGKGEVSMLDLMVNALRMRPDRIIVGEIRRAREAEVLFEAMHTGHSVYSTLHADTAEQTVRRLVNPPINVPEMLLEALHIILAMHRDRRKGIRRVFQLSEIIPSERGVQLNTLFRWRADKDEIIPFKTSMRIMDDLRLYTGMTDQEIAQELAQRQMVLDWLVRHNINTVNTVGFVISEYYSEPEKIISAIKTNISPERILGDLMKELKT